MGPKILLACAIAAVEPGVRQHAGRDAGVGALRHILAVVPQNGARAAVQIQGLIGLVAHEDVGAGLDRCAVGAGRHTPLDDKHEDLLLLGLTDAGARLDAVEGLVVLHGGLTVHNEGGPEFHGVRRVGCDRCGGVRDVEQVALAQLDALVAGDDIVLAVALTLRHGIARELTAGAVAGWIDEAAARHAEHGVVR